MVGNIVDVGWATIKSGCLPITGSTQARHLGRREFDVPVNLPGDLLTLLSSWAPLLAFPCGPVNSYCTSFADSVVGFRIIFYANIPPYIYYFIDNDKVSFRVSC